MRKQRRKKARRVVVVGGGSSLACRFDASLRGGREEWSNTLQPSSVDDESRLELGVDVAPDDFVASRVSERISLQMTCHEQCLFYHICIFLVPALDYGVSARTDPGGYKSEMSYVRTSRADC